MNSNYFESPKNMTLVSHGEAGKFPLYIRREQQNENLWHEHEFVELVMILKGRAEHCIGAMNESEVTLQRGDVFLVPRGVAHCYKKCCDFELLNILYIPELLPMPILDAGTINGFEVLYKGISKSGEKIPFMRLNEELFVELEHDALKLYDESFQRRMGFQFTMMGLFMNLLGKLARSYVTEDSSNDNIYKDMGDVIACLHSRFRQKITLEQLCRIANMSRSSLMRSFSGVMGMPPLQYQLQLRISEAIQLLCMTNKPLGSIAFELGFSDSNYFARQFKKVTGYSPREYRKLHSSQ